MPDEVDPIYSTARAYLPRPSLLAPPVAAPSRAIAKIAIAPAAPAQPVAANSMDAEAAGHAAAEEAVATYQKGLNVRDPEGNLAWNAQAKQEIAATPGIDAAGERAIMDKWNTRAFGQPQLQPNDKPGVIRQTADNVAKGLGTIATVPQQLIDPEGYNDTKTLIETALPTDNSYLNTFASGAGQGIGYAAVSKAGGPVGAQILGAAMGAAQGRTEAYDRRLAGEHVSTGQEAALATAYGAIESATEGLSAKFSHTLMPKLTNKIAQWALKKEGTAAISRVASDVMKRQLGRAAVTAVGTVAENVVEEGAAQVLQNKATAAIVNRNKPGWSEGVGDAMVGGAGGGAIFAAPGIVHGEAEYRQGQARELSGDPDAGIATVGDAATRYALKQIARAVNRRAVVFKSSGGKDAFYDDEFLYVNADAPHTTLEGLAAHEAIAHLRDNTDPQLATEYATWRVRNQDAIRLAGQQYAADYLKVTGKVLDPARIEEEGEGRFIQMSVHSDPNAGEMFAQQYPGIATRYGQAITNIIDTAAGGNRAKQQMITRQFKLLSDISARESAGQQAVAVEEARRQASNPEPEAEVAPAGVEPAPAVEEAAPPPDYTTVRPSQAERYSTEPHIRDNWQRIRVELQQKVAEGKSVNRDDMEPFVGEAWANEVMSNKAPARKPASPDSVTVRRKELEQQLREIVVDHLPEHYRDVDPENPHAMRAYKGEGSRGAVISLESAIKAAEEAEEGHPSKLALHNLRELEKNESRTKIKTVHTDNVADGTRVMVNDGETFTIDRENEQVIDGIVADIPPGGITLYGKKILPPLQPSAEAANADPFVDLPTQHSEAKAESSPEPKQEINQTPTSDTGVFGQTVFRPATGSNQGGLYHEPVQADGPQREGVDARNAAKFDENATPQMFEPPAGEAAGTTPKAPTPQTAEPPQATPPAPPASDHAEQSRRPPDAPARAASNSEAERPARVQNEVSNTHEDIVPDRAAPKTSDDAAFGENNRVFTKSAFEEARAKLKTKFGRANALFAPDPEMIMLATQVAGYYVEAGTRKFADFAKKAIVEFGDDIRPYLKMAYNAVRDYPGMEAAAAQMDDYAAVKATNLDALLAESTSKADEHSATIKTEEAANVPTPSETARNDQGEGAGERSGISQRSGTESLREPESDGGRGASGDADGRGADRGSSETNPNVERASVGREPVVHAVRKPASRSGTGASPRNAGTGGIPGRSNYLAPVGSLTRQGSWLDTARRNFEIIKLVRELETAGKYATPEQQSLIAQYTGFGSSEIANGLFPVKYEYGNRGQKKATNEVDVDAIKPGWREVYIQLQDLLTPAEMATIRQSTQYAHYTSEPVIRSIWAAAQRLGFKGGSILEPGMGTGLFMVAAPPDIATTSKYVGVEMDHLTAAIAKQLLQGHNVIRNSFIDQNLPDAMFDAAFGNPPFSGRVEVLADPRYRKYAFKLHDYFFAKTIDKVRPGGLLTFVTSAGTMNKQDTKARAYMADRADLIGAIRLPQTAFEANAGTEVVTDVLFFRKRAPGEQAGGEAWMNLTKVDAGAGEQVDVNEYFAKHPEMVLGRHSLTGTMYSAKSYTVLPNEGNIEDHFAEAVKNLPQNVYSEQAKTPEIVQAAAIEKDYQVHQHKEGGLYLSPDGKVMQVVDGVGAPIAIPNLKPQHIQWLKDYVPLRDALKKATNDQLTDGDWEASQKALVKAYRAFVKRHGRILEHTISERVVETPDGEKETRSYKRYKWNAVLSSAVDTEITLAQSLESTKDDSTEIADGDILTKRVLAKPATPKIETVGDALAVTLNEKGKFDLTRIAELTKQTPEEVTQQLGDLVFEHPAEGWQTSDEYLSGNVLQKLEEAQAAAALDPRFQRNVESLIKVQPAPLGPDRIVVRLGANWIPTEDVTKFANEVLGISGTIGYDVRSNIWAVPEARSWEGREAGAEFATADRGTAAILQSILSNGDMTIRRTVKENGSTRTYVDKDATAQVNEIAEKMRDRFASWIWTDSDRTGRLLDIYNRKFNNLAPRNFDGSHMTLPGLSLRFKLHPHQLRAIWRVVQTGNTYLNHAVGAGKTLEMIVSAMEQKRLGLIKRPMFVVPNHMLDQFGNEFMQAYPAARILVADKDNFTGDARRRFVAKAALNDWDAIIIKQSSFKLVGVKKESAEAVAEDLLSELRAALEDTEKDDRTTRKRLEAQIEAVMQKVAAATTGSTKDKNLSFEEMGVDFLYVDEAHLYRKLDFATARKVKGIDPNGSGFAFDLFTKLRWLNSQRAGRSAVLASGTPVTNTIAEMYTIQRYLDYDALRDKGLHAFDAWANMFGAVKSDWEQNAAGEYEKVDRFSLFVNVPELMNDVRRYMDVLTMEQLGELVKRPDLSGGQPEMRVAQPSEGLTDYMKGELLNRLTVSKAWKPSKNEPNNPDPVIAIATDGRLAAIDMRFIYPHLKDDPGSKLNLMIDKIIKTHEATKNNVYTTKGDSGEVVEDPIKGSTQIVFSVLGFGDMVEATRGFSPRKWLIHRLKKAGIDASQVAFMGDYKTDVQKEQIFKEMRQGKRRILVGSPANMGTGVNVQKRLVELHFLAPPWYPSDVEQPHGRILRQGNQNKAVDIGWYVTESTYDSTMWGMVRRKGRAIEQAFRGDGARTIEDISEVSMYSMAEAVASGDDRIIKLAEKQAIVEKLSRLQNAYHGDQQTIKHEVEQAKSSRRWHQDRSLKIEAAVEALKDKNTWAPDVVVGGKTFEKPGEIGAAVLEKVTDLAKDEKRQVATVGGFPILVSNNLVTGVDFEASIGGASFSVYNATKIDDINPITLGSHIRRSLGLPAEKLHTEKARIAKEQETIDRLTPRVGAPFEHQAKLAEAIADAASLQQELAKESQAKQAARAQAQEDAKKVPPQVDPDADKRFAISMRGETGSAFSDEDVESRYQAARGVTKPSLLDSLAEKIGDFKRAITRHFIHLDTEKKDDASLANMLRLREAALDNAPGRAKRDIEQWVRKLQPAEYDRFNRLLILPDLVKDAEAGLYEGRELPFGFRDAAHVQDELARLAESAPPAVTDAIEQRNAFTREMTERMVALKILKPDTLDDDRYFHRQVMEYMDQRESTLGGKSGPGAKIGKKGFQKQRTGGGDFNTEYAQAEHEYLTHAYKQIATAETLLRIKGQFDISKRLRAAAKESNLTVAFGGEEKLSEFRTLKRLLAATSDKDEKAELRQQIEPLWVTQAEDIAIARSLDKMQDGHSESEGVDGIDEDSSAFEMAQSILNNPEKHTEEAMIGARWFLKAVADKQKKIKELAGPAFKTWTDLLPDDYKLWTPKAGDTFAVVSTIPQNVVDRLLAGQIGIDEVQIREALMKVPGEQYAIPQHFADQLDEQPQQDGDAVSQMATSLNTAWKQWTLLNPLRALIYNLNNSSGDADAMIAADPMILGELKQAASDLAKFGKGEGDSIDEIERAMSLGVTGSGESLQAIPDISDSGIFKALTGGRSNPLKWYWEKVKGGTAFRENVGRLATFRRAKKLLAAGKSPTWASNKSELAAITDPDEKAAKLARDLVGDYGNISVAGQTIRRRYVPFWSWMEINTPRYFRLFKNAASEGRSGQVGLAAAGGASRGLAIMTLKASAMYGLIHLFNAAMFPDDDDGFEDGRLSLLLGKTADGRTIRLRFQGAFSDALSWLSLENAPGMVQKLSRGEIAPADALADIALATPKKLINASMPIAKTLAETATGKSLFPDPFNPRPIRDRGEHLSRLVSADSFYRWAKDIPQGDAIDVASRLLVQTASPGEGKYRAMRGKVADWLEENGVERGGGAPTDRSNALFYYRKAESQGNKAQAQRWLDRYYKLGGTPQGLKQSLAKAHPLDAIPRAKRQAFIDSLSTEERTGLKQAEAWYFRTYYGDNPIGSEQVHDINDEYLTLEGKAEAYRAGVRALKDHTRPRADAKAAIRANRLSGREASRLARLKSTRKKIADVEKAIAQNKMSTERAKEITNRLITRVA